MRANTGNAKPLHFARVEVENREFPGVQWDSCANHEHDGLSARNDERPRVTRLTLLGVQCRQHLCCSAVSRDTEQAHVVGAKNDLVSSPACAENGAR